MNEKNLKWKLETIKELRKEKLKARIYALIGIIYHTIIPVYLAVLMERRENAFYLIPILIITVVRWKTERGRYK